MNTFQVGLAAYIWEKDRYLCRPFNFYVFKNSTLYDSTVLQFQTSCLKFLRENHFDFNKLFSQGIVILSLTSLLYSLTNDFLSEWRCLRSAENRSIRKGAQAGTGTTCIWA